MISAFILGLEVVSLGTTWLSCVERHTPYIEVVSFLQQNPSFLDFFMTIMRISGISSADSHNACL